MGEESDVADTSAGYDDAAQEQVLRAMPGGGELIAMFGATFPGSTTMAEGGAIRARLPLQICRGRPPIRGLRPRTVVAYPAGITNRR